MPIDVELFDELLKRAAQSPVASHAPVTDADVLRTQLADIDRERQAEMRPGSGPLLTGDPSQLNEALGSMIGQPSGAILAPNSIIRNPEARSRLHEMLLESAESFPSHIRQALTDFTKRYPRLAAHIPRVENIASAGGQYAAGAATPQVSPNANPRVALGLNPALKDYKAAEHTIAHEATHVADALKQAAASRRYGKTPDPTRVEDVPFNSLYNFLNSFKGYWENPMEVKARVTAELRDIHRKDMPSAERWKLARDRAADKVRNDVRIERNVGMPDTNRMAQVDELINHAVNTTKTIDPLPLGGRIEVIDGPTPAATPRQTQPTKRDVDELIRELIKRSATRPSAVGR